MANSINSLFVVSTVNNTGSIDDWNFNPPHLAGARKHFVISPPRSSLLPAPRPHSRSETLWFRGFANYVNIAPRATTSCTDIKRDQGEAYRTLNGPPSSVYALWSITTHEGICQLYTRAIGTNVCPAVGRLVGCASNREITLRYRNPVTTTPQPPSPSSPSAPRRRHFTPFTILPHVG